ncbi:MAG: BolA family transcriptional regulator [Gammaproteobacteria bacterium]|jgi:BolA protein|nr:BolA family transcriptional regulator [Gammaproteobacteria bacterium]MDH3848412.1 BolA family transcriptional regulator [Gammaproteobacteria bacterium]MDH3908234.1 BolA family transcriptional regulator [Gammaproteobacteria bacterium]MDH3953688.1 BolA family transcriptional regulator [Gammaproteobacteria bacterium]MDH4005877.1 BolA family transcriptional regulator [Gammaproteobacteria bacterium]
MSAERLQQIQARLEAEFTPSHLQVKDQSHLHAGHAGARDGMGHFEVTIVANAFEGKSRIDRHRLVYAALGPMMQTDIHALKINAYSPDER